MREGARRLGITYPVAVDSDLATWRSFGNRYWPAHYLADATGQLRQVAFGEGGEATTERLVRELLRQADPDVALPEPVFTPEDDAPTVTGSRTPETYLGAARLRLSYHGRQVNLVVSGEGDLTYSVDGGQERTLHVSGVPNALELLSTPQTSSGTLELTVSPGLALYSFTFG